MKGELKMELREKIINELKYVIDPEMGINIVDLGLVYDVAIIDQRQVKISITLMNKECSYNRSLCEGVKFAVKSIDGMNQVEVEVVRNPAWNPKMMKSELRKQLIGS